jgi:hypothetical protein
MASGHLNLFPDTIRQRADLTGAACVSPQYPRNNLLSKFNVRGYLSGKSAFNPTSTSDVTPSRLEHLPCLRLDRRVVYLRPEVRDEFASHKDQSFDGAGSGAWRYCGALYMLHRCERAERESARGSASGATYIPVCALGTAEFSAVSRRNQNRGGFNVGFTTVRLCRPRRCALFSGGPLPSAWRSAESARTAPRVRGA